jgi:hypothetical protein
MKIERESPALTPAGEDTMEQWSELPLAAATVPRWLKLSGALAGTLLLVLLIYVGCGRRRTDGHGEPSPDGLAALAPVSYPEALPTVWPEITVRIDGVARIDNNAVLAEWAYVNHAAEAAAPFAWGKGQPNFVALSRMVDANGISHAVAVAETGRLLCADTNHLDPAAGSREIHGGRDFPVWAEFDVPVEAKQPYRLALHGVGADSDGIPVPVLSLSEHIARAFVPRSTSWPDLWLRLVGVERRGSRVRVKWQYLNRHPSQAFSWGEQQPNFAALTQVYDFKTGETFNAIPGACSTTNGADGTGWSKVISPGGALDAFAEFDGIPGNQLQILFHSTVPMFIDASKPPPTATELGTN